MSSIDWTASGDEFGICVSSIQGDLDRVVDLMDAIPADKVDAADYENWPVFYKLRDDPKFAEAFESKFGRPFVPAPEDRLSFLELLALLRGEVPETDGGEVAMKTIVN